MMNIEKLNDYVYAMHKYEEDFNNYSRVEKILDVIKKNMEKIPLCDNIEIIPKLSLNFYNLESKEDINCVKNYFIGVGFKLDC